MVLPLKNLVKIKTSPPKNYIRTPPPPSPQLRTYLFFLPLKISIKYEFTPEKYGFTPKEFSEN